MIAQFETNGIICPLTRVNLISGKSCTEKTKTLVELNR